MFNPVITITSKTGRNVRGDQRGYITHAKLYNTNKALCGTEPGRLSSWSEWPLELTYITACSRAERLIGCKRCRAVLYKLGDKPQFGCIHIHP